MAGLPPPCGTELPSSVPLSGASFCISITLPAALARSEVRVAGFCAVHEVERLDVVAQLIRKAAVFPRQPSAGKLLKDVIIWRASCRTGAG
jgi:hypothetical protein